MNISKSAGYAVHALAYMVTKNSDAPVQISEISHEQQVSKTYLAKIFQQLASAQIVVGHRGVTGGYVLSKAAQEITLLNIVEAVDGPVQRDVCCLGLLGCTVRPHCVVHRAFLTANSVFAECLRESTLSEVAESMGDTKQPFVPPYHLQQRQVWNRYNGSCSAR